VDGLLLQLLDDKQGSHGLRFWRCFGPLRSTFNRYYWIFPWQPWMACPAGFDHERDSADFQSGGKTTTSICLWHPGAIGRWADQFWEEQIELWAAKPSQDPARLASEFGRTCQEHAFIEEHAEVWLICSNFTCWKIFTRYDFLLKKIRDHLQGNATIRVYKSNSKDRGPA
jgi:hypothetical protein